MDAYKSVQIPLNDLKRQYLSLQPVLEAVAARVMCSGWYILGPEVEAFEAEFAAYMHSTHCVGVANGTDAMEIALRALSIGPGDEVITVANAGMYSTSAIRAVGAKPVYADIEPDTLILDPDEVAAALSPATKALIITHLYGRMPDMAQISRQTSRSQDQR
jgi:dTDP-4-amino-4,6-dideoxygalactose transaminase